MLKGYKQLWSLIHKSSHMIIRELDKHEIKFRATKIELMKLSTYVLDFGKRNKTQLFQQNNWFWK